MPPGVTRIARVGLNVADLAAARAFYEDGLGFRHLRTETRAGRGFDALTGLDGARAEVAVLRLGREEIELVRHAPAGRPYPSPRAANDPWFQHFAVAVADMPAAYAALSRAAAAPISAGGPQLLPPSTGSVTAYKFRDPDGHPLELSHAPAGPWAEAARAGSVFLGVDHSALAVADLDASLAFYTGPLGLKIGARFVNTGPAQDRLDGLAGVTVDIVTLATRDAGGPHLELLAYRSPVPLRMTAEPRPNDIAATRLVLEVADLAGLADELRKVGAGFVSRPLAAAGDGPHRLLLHDPDGHLLELRGSSVP